MDFALKNEIMSSLERTKELIDSRILWDTEKTIYQKSVFIELLILMKDLLKKTEIKLNKKVNFVDDILVTKNIKDITDLIANFRDACCHVDSWRRKFKTHTFSYFILYGKCKGIKIGKTLIESKYEDDIAFVMGGQILYLKRHIERAFNEIESIFNPIVYSQYNH